MNSKLPAVSRGERSKKLRYGEAHSVSAIIGMVISFHEFVTRPMSASFVEAGARNMLSGSVIAPLEEVARTTALPPSVRRGLRTARSIGVIARAAGNPYDIIGVTRGAAKDRVRQAFRKLTLTEHPDVNPDDPEAAMRFSELVNAYNKIMGDELMPDELMVLRVEATKSYQQKLNKEFNAVGSIWTASSGLPVLAAVIPAAVGAAILWLQQQPVETLVALGVLPTRY